MKHMQVIVPVERDPELDLVLSSVWRNKSKICLVLSHVLPIYIK